MSQKQILLESMPAFLGVDFSNRDYVKGLDLKYKGLVEPREGRFYGGRKVRKEFKTPSGDVAVAIDFSDVKLDGEQFVEVNNLGEATHIKKDCKYYYADGSIYCAKIEFDLIKNKKKLKKSRVQYAIDYLVDTAEQLGASEAVAFIFDGFKKGFDAWKDLGNGDLFLSQLESLVVEDNPHLFYTVNAEIPNFAPKTFKDALVEQITETKWVKP